MIFDIVIQKRESSFAKIRTDILLPLYSLQLSSETGTVAPSRHLTVRDADAPFIQLSV